VTAQEKDFVKKDVLDKLDSKISSLQSVKDALESCGTPPPAPQPSTHDAPKGVPSSQPSGSTADSHTPKSPSP
jgi:hypothetical protein